MCHALETPTMPVHGRDISLFLRGTGPIGRSGCVGRASSSSGGSKEA